MNRFMLFLMAAWTGFYVMAIELLGGRLLAPYFGTSIHVWGGVITVFMLALAAGYFLGGRLSLAEPSMDKLALIMLFAAVAITPVMLAGEHILDGVFTVIEDPRYGSMISALALFFMPTMISGMVLPYAVRLLVGECRSSGHFTGLLYSASTLGSAAGTLITSFYLVRYLEIYQILWGGAAISAAIAGGTLLAGFLSGSGSAERRLLPTLADCGKRVLLFPFLLGVAIFRVMKDE